MTSSRLTPDAAIPQNHVVSGQKRHRSFSEWVQRKILAFFFGYEPDSDLEPLPESVAQPETSPEFGMLSLPHPGHGLAVRIRELGDGLWFIWRDAWFASRTAMLSFFLGAGGLPEAKAEPETQLHTVQLTRGLTGRSFAISACAHILFLVTPLPAFLALPGQRPAVQMAKIENDLQWVPTSRVLPPITPARRASKRPSPGGKPNQPLPPLGAQSKQRQAIVSTPPNPNHPTQTLLQQFALDNARVDTRRVRVPNMVLPPGPAPTPQIDLRRLRIPNAPVDLSGPSSAPLPPRPRSRAELALRERKLENLLPRLAVATSRSTAGVGADDAPDISAPLGPARSGDLVPQGVLALSANPEASGPVLLLPDANLRARIVSGPYTGAGSPGGVPGGVPGAEGGSGGGPGGIAGGPGGGLSAPDIFVAPAGEVPAGPIVVGPGGQSGIGNAGPPPPPPPAKPHQATRPATPSSEPHLIPTKPAEQRARDLLAAIHPGAQSATDGARRQVYVTYLYLSALTSQSSSWLLQYSEFPGAGGAEADALVASPRVIKKVDPCYSADAHWERVEGTVLLYAVIRADGAVEDVVVMRSLEPKIDERALAAFQNSLFLPASKNGRAIPVEVLVEIPFRLAPCI